MGSVTPPAKLSGGGLKEDIATHRTVDKQEIGHHDLLEPKVVEGVGLVNPSVLSRKAVPENVVRLDSDISVVTRRVSRTSALLTS